MRLYGNAKRVKVKHGKVTLSNGAKFSVPCPYSNVNVFEMGGMSIMVICEHNHHDMELGGQILPEEHVHIQGCIIPIDDRQTYGLPARLQNEGRDRGGAENTG